MRFWQLLIGGIALTAVLIYISWRMYKEIAIEPPEPPPPSAASTFKAETSYGQDPFKEAIRIAQASVEAGKVAQTQTEWIAIAQQWQQAADLMTVVSPEDENYEMAQERITVYRNNSQYARQQADKAVQTQLQSENLSGSTPIN